MRGKANFTMCATVHSLPDSAVTLCFCHAPWPSWIIAIRLGLFQKLIEIEVMPDARNPFSMS